MKQVARPYPHHAASLLGSFFEPENGGSRSSETSGDVQRTTRSYMPEDGTLLFPIGQLSYDSKLYFVDTGSVVK
jgi:hypothetical protein